MSNLTIDILNVHQHNLKGLDLSIPLGKITVLTGPSGSGKSTLAMDVLFAEGQHRYLDSLGMAVRRVVHLWDRPQVDAIKGLPPPIALEQRSVIHSPRSKVATLTGIADLLRLLFATCGQAYCPKCQTEIKALSVDQMCETILALPQGTRLTLMAPLSQRLDQMALDQILGNLKKEGFLRVRIDGRPFTLDAPIKIEGRPRSLELVVDRLIVKPGISSRLADSLGLALNYGNGCVSVETRSRKAEGPEILSFSEDLVCPSCGTSFPPICLKLFSCRHPEGMCTSCRGTGKDKRGRTCIDCRGTGLSPFSRSVRIENETLPDLMTWSIDRVYSWLRSLSKWESRGLKNIHAGARIVEAILSRLRPMEEMGLGYLCLDQPAASLSGGEVQRLRLGAQIGQDLTGILYIMDEPTAGLHPSEQEALWQNLCHLRDQGNTVILVEHNLSIIRRADYVIELGPGAGNAGGYLVFSGTPEDLARDQNSITGPYLQGKRRLKRYRKIMKSRERIVLCHAKKNNLRDITVAFPLGCLVCVAGVSGSGKSTLVTDELYHALQGNGETELLLEGRSHNMPKVILVDQAPLTRARYSMPATYMGVFTPLRELFSRTPEARSRGYKASYFSLMRKGGRCERCQGQGFIDLDLQYLPPIRAICDLCGGMRYNREALEIRYKGLNMAEVLDMTIKEASDFFARIPRIRHPLEVIERIGLGYLRLGQPAHTLSGGEAQRLKLARELAIPVHESTIYIMDEPSRGLHQSDLEKFLSILDELIEQGHSVIIIENQPEVLALADWIIELGPGGGPQGGSIVAEGPPDRTKKQGREINCSTTPF